MTVRLHRPRASCHRHQSAAQRGRFSSARNVSTRLAPVQHLARLVHLASDAAPAVLPDDRIAVAARVPLNRMPDIAERGAWAHRVDAFPHRVMRGMHESPHCGRHGAEQSASRDRDDRTAGPAAGPTPRALRSLPDVSSSRRPPPLPLGNVRAASPWRTSAMQRCDARHASLWRIAATMPAQHLRPLFWGFSH